MTDVQKNDRYRRDIDGLRAIAVSAVVLFHAGIPHIQSGFFGVDIFFVISGYLIGKIIVSSVAESNFSFVDFYARRAEGILPALFIVILFICIFGWYVLSAIEYRGVGATSMSALIATSNISFLRQSTDYFNSDSRRSPFL